ncbi:MAG: SUMF1/EgtB/PvdO family nonheme iron enzyme [Arcobacter sp.]|nr:SUMF1/EgtB/PvdO family nonheme iron enzyme [Arcobacter sp.]
MSKSINFDLNLIPEGVIVDFAHDSLDFKTYSEVIIEAIISAETPFTVGIFSKAGKGKTSLMKLIEREINVDIKNNDKILTAFFNALKFQNNEHPILSFCNVIEKTIQKDRSSFDQDTLINILNHIKNIKYKILNIKIQIDDLKNENSLINTEKSFEKQFLDKNSFFQIFDLVKGLELILIEQNLKIVIFIDDLDKCLPKSAIKIIECINLILDLKGLYFVLAIDRDIIENFLDNRISSKYDINKKYLGKTYLDKIIQLPFYIPSCNGKILNLLENIYSKNNTSLKLEDEIKNVILSIPPLNIITPRFIVRLINRIKVNSKIFIKINPEIDLTKESILSLFSISCTLEELYNDMYHLLIANDDVVKYLIKTIQHEVYIQDDLDINLNINKTQKDKLLKILENDFNSFKIIFSTEQGKFWLEERSFRLETFEFLHSKKVEPIVQTTPIYKTEFENIIELIENKEVNEKEFIKIPNRNFEMSKYVITNKWFNEFIKAGGYLEKNYWSDMASKIWLMNNKIDSLDQKYQLMLKNEKNYYQKKYKKNLIKENFNKDLQPIVYITYYEAQAFCNYLSEIDKVYTYSIPTNEQWDYVAKAGEEERLFPWGNTWNKNYCNNSSNQLHKTSEIDTFPQGNSKFGISDIAGNVWSWTSSLEKNEYNYLKGGSWNFSDTNYFKVSNNKMTFFNNPGSQYYDIGFFCIRIKK